MKGLDEEVIFYDTNTGKTGRATLRELYSNYVDRMKAQNRLWFTFAEWLRVYSWAGKIMTK